MIFGRPPTVYPTDWDRRFAIYPVRLGWKWLWLDFYESRYTAGNCGERRHRSGLTGSWERMTD